MEIYLIRHTTPKIDEGICYGQTDLEVTTDFAEEVQKIRDQVSFDNSTKIYSSPLQRCIKLAETFELPVQIEDRLMEVDFGQWELKKWSEIPDSDLNPWMENFVEAAPPQGESYLEVQERVLSFFSEILQSKYSTILLCTHASPIRLLLAHIQNIALKDSFEIKVAYGQVFKIKYDKKKLYLIPQ